VRIQARHAAAAMAPVEPNQLRASARADPLIAQAAKLFSAVQHPAFLSAGAPSRASDA
jgi:hypothetical protein